MNYNNAVPLKVLLLTAAVILAPCCSSRSNLPSSSNEGTTPQSRLTFVPPFQTKEPEKYSAQRTITSTTTSGDIVTREVVMRNGAMRKREVQSSTGSIVIYLETPSGRFLIMPEGKLYADITSEHVDSEIKNEESEQLEATDEHVMHATNPPATYVKLGNETFDGHNCTKYRVVVNTTDSDSVTKSETSIWIDDSLGMPVRSETISGNGSKTLMELTNVKSNVDDDVFSIPKDYQKVKPEVIRRLLKTQ